MELAIFNLYIGLGKRVMTIKSPSMGRTGWQRLIYDIIIGWKFSSAEADSVMENKAAAAATLRRTGRCWMLRGWPSAALPDIKSELVWRDSAATAWVKGKSAGNR